MFDLDGVDPDLSHCVLRGGCLREARLGRASLAQAEVEGCAFHRSLLWGADLSGLRGAALSGANFSRADLRGAELRAQDLRECQLQGALLEGALLEEAHLPEGFNF